MQPGICVMLQSRRGDDQLKDICLVFEVHQPFRLRKDFFWGKNMLKNEVEDLFGYYFSREENRELFLKVADKCYFPSNELILRLIDRYSGEFKVAFSLSGVFIEQCEMYSSDLLETFRQLRETGCVEFLGQTYYHSLSSLYEDRSEFVEQVEMHRQVMKDLLDYEPRVFENTELLYNNSISEIVESLGYAGMFAEGAEKMLRGRSPNYVYKSVCCDKMKILLRNYTLTDDIGFRFSARDWESYPLTPEKYAAWIEATPGQCINIFLDYETFGEHHWKETGIFRFLENLPEKLLGYDITISTPSEILGRHDPVDFVDVRDFETISWADMEKDTSCFIGNTMQWACFEHLKWMEKKAKALDDDHLNVWRYLGVSDHLYYMFTRGGSAGEVHSYFSPFDSPYDAFITFFSIILDFDARVRWHIR